MPEQPIPIVTHADVEGVVRRKYPEARVAEVLGLLSEYGGAASPDASARVRLAVLKLAGGRLDRLRSELETARMDFRDVLAPAEYPNYCRNVFPPDPRPPEAIQRIIDADRQQYQAWLSR